MRIFNQLGDVQDVTVSDTTDSSGMETITFAPANTGIGPMLLLGAVLYLVFTSSKTKQKHYRAIRSKASQATGFVSRRLKAL